VARSIGLGIALFVLWLLLSGIYTPLLIILGIFSSTLVAWIAHRMNVADHEGFPIHFTWTAISYWPWLLWEIVKANINVSRIIIKKEPSISPILFRIPADQNTELGQVTYANSITLTPGTVSIAVGEGMIDVHALTQEAADDLKSGRMNERACRLEGNVHKQKELIE
jgi:multicomponent Na+:H+ antiporter subunit E